MNKEELKKEYEEWLETQPLDNYDSVSWWLSKFDAYKAELVERIEEMKIREGEKYGVPTVVPDGGKIAALQDSMAVISHNSVLIRVSNLIKEGK
jgi:hypothetical protein